MRCQSAPLHRADGVAVRARRQEFPAGDFERRHCGQAAARRRQRGRQSDLQRRSRRRHCPSDRDRALRHLPFRQRGRVFALRSCPLCAGSRWIRSDAHSADHQPDVASRLRPRRNTRRSTILPGRWSASPCATGAKPSMPSSSKKGCATSKVLSAEYRVLRKNKYAAEGLNPRRC